MQLNTDISKKIAIGCGAGGRTRIVSIGNNFCALRVGMDCAPDNASLSQNTSLFCLVYVEQIKPNRTIYRLARGFIVFFMLFSAWFSYTHAIDLEKLGFPDYFRI